MKRAFHRPSNRGLNCNTRLDEQKVMVILRSPLSHVDLARLYEVKLETIRSVRKRKSWRHVQ